MEKSVYVLGGIIAGFFALRYIFFRFMVIPMQEQMVKEAFKAQVRSQAEEFEKLNQEIKDAKIQYDRAKRDALDKSDSPS